MKENPVIARRHKIQMMLLQFITQQYSEGSMLITNDDLAKALHFHPSQHKRMKKCLQSQGIKFYVGSDGRPFTTTELISDYVTPKNASNDSIYFDEKQNGP